MKKRPKHIKIIDFKGNDLFKGFYEWQIESFLRTEYAWSRRDTGGDCYRYSQAFDPNVFEECFSLYIGHSSYGKTLYGYEGNAVIERLALYVNDQLSAARKGLATGDFTDLYILQKNRRPWVDQFEERS